MYRRPAIIRHIHRLDINPLDEEEEPMDPPFAERVHFIIRHASSLRKLVYIVIDNDQSSNYSVRLLRTCIAALEWAETKPWLSIATRRPILGTPLGDLLLYINDKFSLTKLDVQSEGIHDNPLLEFLSRFHHLRKLEIWNFCSSDNNEHDMDRFLGHLPLRKLTLFDTEQVASLPHQLQVLNIGSDGSPILTNSVWTAACNLKCLSELDIQCDDTEETQNEEPFVFKSSNLQTLSGTLTAKTEEILINQIIQPILVNCHHLTSIDLLISSSLSTIFLSVLLSNESLMYVDITSTASPYTFQEFSALPKTLPNLESLQLPWPASIGVPTNDDEDTVMDWRYDRDRNQDLPDCLTYDQCQRLAEKFPKLNEIVFEMDAEVLDNTYQMWSESFEDNMPLDPATVDIDKARRDQSFKMTIFIDQESPCLDLCSVFVCSFGDSNYTDQDGYPQMSMTLYSFLESNSATCRKAVTKLS